MLLLKHLPKPSTRIRAEIVRLSDAAAGTAGESPDGRPESAREDTGVEGSCLRVLAVGRTRGGASGKDFPLSVVDQGLEVAMVPQVYLLPESHANVPGSADSWCCLQH